MANSKYEYVKTFELSDKLLPQCWIVVRLDGRAFTKFSAAHSFQKPNDLSALQLMNEAARQCCQEFPDIVLAYGSSDEYSFVFRKNCQLYDRRASKLVSVLTSYFTACYVLKWPQLMPLRELQYPPSFDGRAVCYPSDAVLRDYLAWRQADCHVNNQYNTCFWSLVQEGGLSHSEAQATLKGTLTKDKNEILFSRFNINYNTLPEIFRKGSVVFRKKIGASASEEEEKLSLGENGEEVSATALSARVKYKLVVEHMDIINDAFWSQHPHILGKRAD